MQDDIFIDRLIAGLQQRLGADAAMEPTLEDALRATLADAIERLDLITRDTFSEQEQQLAQLRTRLELLEQEVTRLERLAGN